MIACLEQLICTSAYSCCRAERGTTLPARSYCSIQKPALGLCQDSDLKQNEQRTEGRWTWNTVAQTTAEQVCRSWSAQVHLHHKGLSMPLTTSKANTTAVTTPCSSHLTYGNDAGYNDLGSYNGTRAENLLPCKNAVP